MKKPPQQSLEFQSADLAQVLNAKSHELRTLLQFEPLASREKKRRSATHYSAMDVLFLLVVKKLYDGGFAPKSISTFSASLYKTLQQTATLSSNDEIVMHRKEDGAWKFGAAPANQDAMELKIPLRQSRAHLLRFTGVHQIAPQTEMPFLASVQSTTGRGRSR